MLARMVDMHVGMLVINAVDAHLYHEHFDAAKEWMKRYEQIDEDKTLCQADFTLVGKPNTIDDFQAEDFVLENYKPQKYIKAKLLT
jgi:thymidylate synthase